jgi:hypothetical protein
MAPGTDAYGLLQPARALPHMRATVSKGTWLFNGNMINIRHGVEIITTLPVWLPTPQDAGHWESERFVVPREFASAIALCLCTVAEP